MNDSSTEEVFIFSPFFFPEQISTGKYNTHLAEELVMRGCTVKVFASHPLYPDWKVKKSLASIAGVTIYRGGEWLKYPRSALLRRAVLELWYCWFVFTSYSRIKCPPTLVIAVFPPSLFFLLLSLILPSGVKKVGLVHDLQGIYASRSSGFVAKLIKSAIYFVEKRCFTSCDQLIFLSASMATTALIEYKLKERKSFVCYPFAVIPNKAKFETSNLVNVLPPELINVVYSGALGDKQNPNGLFIFLNQLANALDGIACHIFSGGPVFEKLKARQEVNSNCKVQLHDLVPLEQLNELYERSDIQVIPQAVGTAEGSLPSKLPNLLSAGVPIFAICDEGSELGDLILEANAGVVATTWNTEELVDKFLTHRSELFAEPRIERKERLQGFVNEKFSIKKLVDVILTDSIK